MLSWITAQPIAHRGLHDAARGIAENSLAAFRAAIAGGYGIELDLRRAKDGVAVFHDRTLARMTGDPRALAQVPMAELSRLRLGGSEETIPGLEETLALVAGRVPLFLEIKNDGGAGALEAEALAGLAGYRGALAVVSFNPFSLAWFRRHAPQIPRGQTSGRLAGLRLSQPRRWAQQRFLLNWASRPDFILYELAALPNPWVSALRARGMPLIAFTARSEADARQARAQADNFIFENFRP